MGPRPAGVAACAGPLPPEPAGADAPKDSAEIGPSYQLEQQEKKKTEAAKQDAVLEFILSQNIALHAAFKQKGFA